MTTYQSRIGKKETHLILSQNTMSSSSDTSPQSRKMKRKASQRSRRESKTSPPQQSVTKKIRTECSKCEEELGPVYINCNWCESGFCQPCSKLSEAAIQVFKDESMPGCTWNCPPCTKTSASIQNIDRKLDNMDKKSEDRMTVLEKKLDGIEERITTKIKAEIPKLIKKEVEVMKKDVVSTVEGQVKEVETRVVDKLDKQIEKVGANIEGIRKDIPSKQQMEDLMKEMIQKEMGQRSTDTNQPGTSSQQTSPGTQMRNTVASVTSEMREKRKREKRLIIHRLEEQNTNLKAERESKDKDTIIDIASKTLGLKNIKKDDIILAERLGEKKDDQPHPLLIELSDLTKKNMILRRATQLQESPYQHISIRYDMTKLEREQQKKLIEEAKKMEENLEEESVGKFQFRVRGPPWDMKIKKMKTKPDQIETEKDETERMEEGSTVG